MSLIENVTSIVEGIRQSVNENVEHIDEAICIMMAEEKSKFSCTMNIFITQVFVNVTNLCFLKILLIVKRKSLIC